MAFVQRVQQADFDRFIKSRKIVVVRLQSGDESRFNASILDYLEAEYRYNFSCGWFNIDSIVAVEYWAKTHLQGFAEARSGYLLAVNGSLRDFYAVADLFEQSSRARKSAQGFFTGHQGDPLSIIFANMSKWSSKEEAKKIIQRFCEIIEGRLDPTDPAKSTTQSAPPHPAPQQSKSKQTPYDILGIQPSDTDEVITRARDNLLKKNHPDLLTQFDVNIQKVGSERTIEINAAYQEIMRTRKINKRMA